MKETACVFQLNSFVKSHRQLLLRPHLQSVVVSLPQNVSKDKGRPGRRLPGHPHSGPLHPSTLRADAWVQVEVFPGTPWDIPVQLPQGYVKSLRQRKTGLDVLLLQAMLARSAMGPGFWSSS